MQIKDSFLEPEVRDGFYVPSEVKQAWAAQLEVLEVIDKICKKHQIMYFADWGTLLGAVRHGGFIPWDDDLDITMKRADYKRFLKVAEKELPEEYAINTYDRHPDCWSFIGRVVAKSKICFEEEHLKKYHGFPYIAGIDIFVLDYVSEDEEKEKERTTIARYVLAVADEMAEGNLFGKSAEDALKKIEKILHIKLKNKKNLYELRVELYRIVEQLFDKFQEKESKVLTRMMPDGLYGDGHLHLLKDYYDEQIWLPFEMTQIPVPTAYDEMLRKRYGDYMKLVRDCGGHDYPFFEKQKQQLQAVLDFEMPGYKYRGITSRNQEIGKEKSLKFLILQAYKELERLYQTIIDCEDLQKTPNFVVLQEIQQIAIDMGTLIEQCKGKGYTTVSILERYCEIIYEISKGCTIELLYQLASLFSELGKSIQREIVERKEVVFLPYKASEWEYIRSVWQAAMNDENCDVYVIPIPYFYKEWDGVLRTEKYEADFFPKNVNVVRYDEFDFELHHPDMIFIQNPYDEFDSVISVHPFFYSSNLKNYTEKLIYIPPFVLEEFTKENYREYFNMRYYCTISGVVNADTVIVQSENMKRLYVEKLTEFAGKDTREIWEEKIVGLGSPKEDIKKETVCLPMEWQKYIERENGSRKKVVLYHTELSSYIQYGEQMITKMKEVFQIFSENCDNVVVLWKPHPLTKMTLKQSCPRLYQEYCILEREYLKSEIGILDESSDDERAVEACDAYYGDVSPVMQMCRNAGKAVMRQKT